MYLFSHISIPFWHFCSAKIIMFCQMVHFANVRSCGIRFLPFFGNHGETPYLGILLDQIVLPPSLYQLKSSWSKLLTQFMCLHLHTLLTNVYLITSASGGERVWGVIKCDPAVNIPSPDVMKVINFYCL